MRGTRRAVFVTLLFCFTALTCAAQQKGPLPLPPPGTPDPGQQANAAAKPLVVPAGTTIPIELTGAIWTKKVKPGDDIFAVTVFPFAISNQMGIPAGTYVQGVIDTVTHPGLFSWHAQFQIHFTELIFASGYTFVFANDGPPPGDVASAVSTVYVEVAPNSDILLDNGSEIQMLFQLPVSLDAAGVAMAANMNQRPQPGPTRTASLCRPTAGTPDTVFPGTPGTPGTPDTVIPQGPGLPDIVIPGTPATPGTPDTVISGSPGTTCPGPPIVTDPKKQPEHTMPMTLSAATLVGSTLVQAGSYNAVWAGLGPTATVEIREKKKTVATATARVLLLSQMASGTTPATETNADGSVSLQSLRFEAQRFALYFDSAAVNPGVAAKAP